MWSMKTLFSFPILQKDHIDLIPAEIGDDHYVSTPVILVINSGCQKATSYFGRNINLGNCVYFPQFPDIVGKKWEPRNPLPAFFGQNLDKYSKSGEKEILWRLKGPNNWDKHLEKNTSEIEKKKKKKALT